MFIINLTRGNEAENIVLRSLKVDKDDEDITIAPQQYIDTDTYCIPDRKVEKSQELKEYEAQGKLRVARQLPKRTNAPESEKQAQEIDAKRKLLDNIASTTSLSLLKDAIRDDKNDIEVIRAAAARLDDLLGEEGTDIPESVEGRAGNYPISS